MAPGLDIEALAKDLTDTHQCQVNHPGLHHLTQELGIHNKRGLDRDRLSITRLIRRLGCPSATRRRFPTSPVLLEVMSRFFATVQLHVAPESVPSVWVATNMISAGADRRSYGMAQKAKLGEANKDAWSTTKAWPSASIGNSFEVVNPRLTSKIIDVQDVERPTMVPSLALAERRIKGLTTYDPSSWSKELSKHNLIGKYPNLVKGITLGFNLGIPAITKTYTPRNHISIDIHHDHIRKVGNSLNDLK